MRSAGLFISPRNTPCTDCDARCRGSHHGTLRTLKDRACRAATRCYSHISWCRVDRTARSTPFRTGADTRSVPGKRQLVRTARAVARNERAAWKYMPATTSNTRIPGQVGMLSSRGSFRLPLRLVFCTRGGGRGRTLRYGVLNTIGLKAHAAGAPAAAAPFASATNSVCALQKGILKPMLALSNSW